MRRLLLLMTALALVLAACGGGDDGDEVASLDSTTTTAATEVTTTTVDETAELEANLLAFSECMRDNGIPDFPDPTIDADGNPEFFPGGTPPEGFADEETIQDAFEECQGFIEDVVLSFLPEDTTELEDRFLEWATCMRDQGVDIPDPDFSQGLFGPNGPGGIFGEIDPNDPDFAAASDECAYLFEGLLPGAPTG
jgi:hypothetical protein